MTEKRGGSDVNGGTETLATPIKEQPGLYSLVGYKWFSSATDSDIALVLGRINDMSSGLSMFLLRTRDPETNTLNGIEIVKLKNKLGTRQLPTAELVLNGSEARILSDEGRGVAGISNMLTITRLHNIISSVALQRKIVSLARDYSQRRMAFDKKIAQHPLHLRTMSHIEVDVRGCTAIMLDLARQLGLQDTGSIEDADRLLLRLMMPVAKMFTAKKAVANASEGIECFGGQVINGKFACETVLLKEDEDTVHPDMLKDDAV
jgi:alkylation response protein AidB-like acyl-CoA dehydrogenase